MKKRSGAVAEGELKNGHVGRTCSTAGPDVVGNAADPVASEL